MRYAIYVATRDGGKLAARIVDALEQGDVYVLEKYREGMEFSDDLGNEQVNIFSYANLSDCVGENFFRYDAHIFLMATGIAVRMIAPHIRDKLTDPAVVVMDESGRFTVSLISGHMGKANVLTQMIADAMGSTPVITTATDAKGLLAPDQVAADLSLRPFPRKNIKVLNAAVLTGANVCYYVDTNLENSDALLDALLSHGIKAEKKQVEELPEDGYVVFLTDKEITKGDNLLCLLKRKVIAGVGCRRGVPTGKIIEALELATKRIGLTVADIELIASTTFKQEERGLLEAAEILGKEVRFFGNEKLREVIKTYSLPESKFVERTIGVGNVCEAAAIACVARGRLALPKTKFDEVTVALLWKK